MNLELISELQDFCKWANDYLNKPSSFDIVYWYHTGENRPEIKFQIWIKCLLNERGTLEDLVKLIPGVKATAAVIKDDL